VNSGGEKISKKGLVNDWRGVQRSLREGKKNEEGPRLFETGEDLSVIEYQTGGAGVRRQRLLRQTSGKLKETSR